MVFIVALPLNFVDLEHGTCCMGLDLTEPKQTPIQHQNVQSV